LEKTNSPGVYQYISKRLYRKKPDACYYIMYRDNTGKVCREKVGWLSEKYTLADAVRIRAERIHAVRHGDELPKDKTKAPLFGDLASSYLAALEADKRTSHASDQSRYDRYLKEPLAAKQLDQITVEDLEAIKNNLASLGRSAQTIRHVLALVRRIINRAIVLDKWTGSNPVKKIKIPRPNNARLRFLTYDEAKSLLAALKAKSVLVHDMALLALHCGLRLGEITALTVSDIDINNDIIHILDPKNGESRTAYMTSEVKAALKARAKKAQAGLLFVDRKNHGQISDMSHTFDRVVADLGLNQAVTDRRHKVVFHTLRHTFGSWLALQGESPFVIQKLLGHKTLTMTERYSHLAPSQMKRAVSNLESVLNTTNGKPDTNAILND